MLRDQFKEPEPLVELTHQTQTVVRRFLSYLFGFSLQNVFPAFAFL